MIDHTAPNSRDIFVLWRVNSEGRFVPDYYRESMLASVLQAASPRAVFPGSARAEALGVVPGVGTISDFLTRDYLSAGALEVAPE